MLRIKIMRLSEILFWNNEPSMGTRADPQLNFPTGPLSDDLTNLANAFTRSGLVKRGWNTNRWEGQPSGPAPPNAEAELIPNGTSEPTTASWQAEPVEIERPVVQHRLVRQVIQLPRRSEDRPDRDRLALRFEQFKKSA
jgi:hypothetical protein